MISKGVSCLLHACFVACVLHQFLLHLGCQILMYVASRLASGELGEAAGAVVTQTDLNELERLNRGNIHALEEIVGHHGRTETEHELRRRGPSQCAPQGPNCY